MSSSPGLRRQLQRLAALMALALAVAGWAGAAPILDGARIVEKTYDNGFRLIMKPERQWDLVAVGLYVRAGSFCETDEEAGVAHLLEHLLFEATVKGETQTVGPAIEELGGYVNASTTRDFTRIDVTVASQYLEQVIEMLASAAFNLEVTDTALTREREVILRELADRQAVAEGMLERLIWGTAYTAHPYRREIGGTEEQVKDLTLEELQAFHKRFYVPGNMALVAVGDLDPDALTEQVGRLFGARAGAPFSVPDPRPEPAQTSSRTVVEQRKSDTTIVNFAWHAPGIANRAEVWAMDLIYTILGDDRIGRLRQSLDEQGLSLMSSTDFLTQRYPGLFIVTILTKPDKELEVRSAVLAEVGRLRSEPVTEQELSEAKRTVRAQYAFSNEAYSDQVGTLGFYEAIGAYRLAVDYLAEVEQVSAADLQAVARKYLIPDAYTLVIVRPESRPGETGEARIPWPELCGLG